MRGLAKLSAKSNVKQNMVVSKWLANLFAKSSEYEKLYFVVFKKNVITSKG